jgi:hypothetical protein
MVLIIGDGIQEAAEALTSISNSMRGFTSALSLSISRYGTVSMGLDHRSTHSLRTLLVERGIVVFGPTGHVGVQATSGTEKRRPPRPTTASQLEFFDQLYQHRPGLSTQTKALIAGLAELGISPEFRKSLVLR